MSSDLSGPLTGKTRGDVGRWNRCQTLWALPLLAWVLIGCHGPETTHVPLVKVSGTITLDGEPLANAVVVFEGEDGSFSFAETDSRGRYALKFDSQSRGTTQGRKTVRISMNRRLLGLNSNDEGGPGDSAGGSFKKQPTERIPEKYNLRSTLSAHVTASARRFDFDLFSESQAKRDAAVP